jgi:spermidine synthase
MEASLAGGSATATGRRGDRNRVVAFQVIFAISGVCGLIYESIWSHYLKLFVGHAAYAQTVVLVVFIGGMALGAGLVGRFADRIRNPLLGYAIVEGVIGVLSLVFHGVFVASTDWAYASLLPAACVPESPCITQWVFAALLILPQSILLGTTFPLMTGGILRLARKDPGQRIALLYFLNSVGAAAGVLLSGFVLIPAMGLPGTLLTAGLMNIAVAIAAWACARGSAIDQTKATAPASLDSAGASTRRLMIIVAALTGLSSFVYEIIWIRMLSLVVGTSTHAFELMLAAFILGLAFGGLWIRKRIDRYANLIATLAIVQVLMGIAAIATLALYDGMFDFMSGLLAMLRRSESSYFVFNVANHALALVIMFPATFLAGMTFPLITTALFRGADGERAIGYTYAANTFGSIIGVAIAVHFAMPVLGLKGGLLFGAAIDILLGVVLLSLGARAAGFGRAIGWGTAGMLAIVIVAITVPVLPERMASGVYRSGRAKLEPDREIVFHRDGKTASVTITRTPSATTIATNGKPDASISRDPGRPTSDEVTMTIAGILPLAFMPEARTAAVIGFGSGMTTTTLLGSPKLERVDTIEIESQMAVAARNFGEIVGVAYSDPRSRIVIDDAKSYFARSNTRYDVIVSEPSNPWVSGVASLFTQEFYVRIRRQLNPGGIFVQWVHAYEFNDRLVGTILRALDSEFRDYEMYAANDGDLIIVASAERLPGTLNGEYASWPQLKPLLDRVGFRTVDELHLRHLAGKRTIRALLPVFGEGVNSDYYPIVDQSAPFARFLGESAGGLMRTATAPIPIVELLGEGRRLPATIPARPVAAPMQQIMVASAREASEFLRTGRVVEPSSPLLLRDIGLLRAILFDCASIPVGVSIHGLLLPVANLVTPSVDRSQAASLWESLRKAPCATKMNSRDREWMDLFAAVADRNAARMAQLGARLSADAETADEFRAYAVMAAATGMLATEQHEEAARFLAGMSGRLSKVAQDDPPMRLLVVLSRREHAKQAAMLK